MTDVEFLFFLIGVMTATGFAFFSAVWLWMNYKRKWRLQRKPFARCFCKHCKHWSPDISGNGSGGCYKGILYPELAKDRIQTTDAYHFCSFACPTNPVEHHHREKSFGETR